MYRYKSMTDIPGSTSGTTMGSRVRFEISYTKKYNQLIRLTNVYNTDNGWYLRCVAEIVK